MHCVFWLVVHRVSIEDRFHVTPLSLAVAKGVSPMMSLVSEAALVESGLEDNSEAKDELLQLVDKINSDRQQAAELQETLRTDSKTTEIVGLTMNVMGRKMRINGPRVHSEAYIPAEELRKVYRK